MMKVLHKLAAADAKTKADKAEAYAKTKDDAKTKADEAETKADVKAKSDAKAAAEWALMNEFFGSHSDSE